MALLAALGCLAGLAVTGVVAYLVPVAQTGDAGALNGYVDLAHGRSDAVLLSIVHLASPFGYGVIASVLIVVALLRRRFWLAALLPVVIVMAPFTTERLKHLLAHPREAEWLGHTQINAASWPSGHATASMTLALCAVLVAPQVLRPLAALVGTTFALAVSFSMLMLHGHFPSDIVGGYLCSGAWVLTAVAVLRRLEHAAPARRRAPLTVAEALPLVSYAAFVAGVGAIVVLDRPRALLSYLVDRPAFTLSAVAIAMLAMLLPGLLAQISREPSAR